MIRETLRITDSEEENGKYAGPNNENYTGTNLATYVRTDADGKKKFYIGMKETPTFKSINIGSSSFENPQKDLGPSNITADDNGLTLTHNKASITISKADDKTENKAKISGLKDFNVNDQTTQYGQSGVAATQKEVTDYVAKEITKVNDSQSKLKNGTLGTVVYTDPTTGERLVKGNDGKYYKPADLDTDGTPKAGKDGIENPVLSLVNGKDGKTTTRTALGNLANGLSGVTNSTTGTAISAEDAQKAINGDAANPTKPGLLAQTTGFFNIPISTFPSVTLVAILSVE